MATTRDLFEILMLAAALWPLEAIAQIRSGPEVFGHIGYARTDDDEGWIGSGVRAGGGMGYRLSRRWSVQAGFDMIRHERNRHGFRARGRAHFLTGNVALHFRPEKRFQPYISGGPGLVGYRNHLFNKWSAGFALNVGAGVRAYVTPRFFLQPEVRLLLGKPGREVVDNLQAGTFSVGGGFAW
jgi:opacity protein-like surface antigen